MGISKIFTIYLSYFNSMRIAYVFAIQNTNFYTPSIPKILSIKLVVSHKIPPLFCLMVFQPGYA